MSDPDRLAEWTLAEIKAGGYEPPEENPRQAQEIIAWLVAEAERLRDGIRAALDCHTETTRRLTLQELLAGNDEAPLEP